MTISLILGLLFCGDNFSFARQTDAVFYKETREYLKDLVRFDTSNPPGNEILAAT